MAPHGGDFVVFSCSEGWWCWCRSRTVEVHSFCSVSFICSCGGSGKSSRIFAEDLLPRGASLSNKLFSTCTSVSSSSSLLLLLLFITEFCDWHFLYACKIVHPYQTATLHAYPSTPVGLPKLKYCTVNDRSSDWAVDIIVLHFRFLLGAHSYPPNRQVPGHHSADCHHSVWRDINLSLSFFADQ